MLILNSENTMACFVDYHGGCWLCLQVIFVKVVVWKEGVVVMVVDRSDWCYTGDGEEFW